MKKFVTILAFLLLAVLRQGPVFAQEADGLSSQEQDMDVTELIMGHIGDAYEWHLTSWKGGDIAIPLPVIVRSKISGWHCFLSSKLEEGRSYEGFVIAPAGDKYAGKVVETVDGGFVRPFDISITKTVFAIMFNAVLLVVIILLCARWYRRHDVLKEPPHGVAALMEPVIVMIENDVIKDAVGEDYKRYSPYLLTVFFFILINNLMGIIPFFPGGANVTGNIAVTLVLALCTFIVTNLFGNRHYWKDILWPDVPVFLKAPLPIMQVIEFIGLFTKPFSLMVRLFANILAGHAVILGLVCVIFVTAKMGPVICGSMTVVSLIFGIFMDCLELLVAFIQAYVFTILSSVFIGMSRQHIKN